MVAESNDYGTLHLPGNPGKNNLLEAQQAVDAAEVLRLLPLARRRLLHLIETEPSEGHELIKILSKLAGE